MPGRRGLLRAVVAVAAAAFVLCLPLYLVTATISGAVNEVRLYQYGFDRYGVSEDTGIGDEELLRAARELIAYFNSGQAAVQITVENAHGEEVELFGEREVAHLKDVKALIRLSYRIAIGTLAYMAVVVVAGLLLYRERFWPQLARLGLWGGAFTIALLCAVGIAAAVDFQWLFIGFHRLFFSGDTWILAPSDYLIRMFPPPFFNDAALFVVGAVVVEALLVGGLGGLFWFRRRRAG